MLRPFLTAVSLLVLGAATALAQTAVDNPTPLTPRTADGREIAPVTYNLGGRPLRAWQTSAQTPALRYKIPPSLAKLCYLRITYVDHSYDRLAVTYRNSAGTFVKPDKIIGAVLLDSGKPTVAYAFCADPSATPELEIRLAKGTAAPLTVFAVGAQGQPFADAHFQYVLDEAWKRPYAGPSAANIDNGTLKGRVMVGYQGWFRTPNDPCDRGWVHWGDIGKGLFTVDMWPDVSQYPANCLEKAADVKTRSGKTAALFSSAWPEVVRTHFAWMRQHGIDGAFVQRFVPGGDKEPDWVLGNVRAAANQEGRLWAVEYDVSGCPDDRLLDKIRTDWSWMIDHFGIRQDRSYAREGNKLVVFVWGMPFPDRHISSPTADAVVDFLKHDPVYGGAYVIGGIPGWFRTLGPEWDAHIAKYDSALVWQSTRFVEDRADLEKLGVTYYPMVRPGFSWANLKHLPTDSKEAYDPRQGGAFYEGQLSRAVAAGADRLFVGMFDEYDEGTAIAPMSDDPPPTNRRAGTNAVFFANRKFEGHAADRLLPQIDLPLDAPSPDKRLPSTDFSVRLNGQLMPPSTGTYSFVVRGPAGDDAALWIGTRQSRIDDLGAAGSLPLTATLTAGQPVVFKLECRHGDQPGRLQLLWSTGDAPPKLVPPAAFLDAWGRFITNEGKPADWWLTLTERWREKMRQANH